MKESFQDCRIQSVSHPNPKKKKKYNQKKEEKKKATPLSSKAELLREIERDRDRERK